MNKTKKRSIQKHRAKALKFDERRRVAALEAPTASATAAPAPNKSKPTASFVHKAKPAKAATTVIAAEDLEVSESSEVSEDAVETTEG